MQLLKLFFWLLGLINLSTLSYAFAQDHDKKIGIEDTQFIIQKERKNILPETSRLFEKVLPPPEKIEKDSVQYTIKELSPKPTPLQRKIKVLRAKQELLTKLYGHYVKIGYGSLFSPYLEGFFNNTRNQKYTYGIHLKHFSTQKGTITKSNAEESRNTAAINGTVFTQPFILKGTMQYQRDKYHFYGNVPQKSINRNAKKQILNWFGGNIALESYRDSTWINYQGNINFDRANDFYQTQENQLGLYAKADYPLNDTLTIRLIADLYTSQYTNGTAIKRYVARIQPRLLLPLNLFQFEVGFNLAYQNDTSAAVNPFNVYPFLEAHCLGYDWITPYAGIKGGLQKTSWQKFLKENPFLTTSPITLLHTHQTFSFYGGTQGKIQQHIGFHTGFTLSNYKNLYFFVNHTTIPEKFDIAYDRGNTLVSNLFGEMTYENPVKNFTGHLRGDYFAYKTHHVKQAWHRPQYQFDLFGSYHLYRKIWLKTALHWLGGLKALDPATHIVRKLKDVVELGVGAEYLLTKRFSTFLNVQNLLWNRNERYLHYPSQGFQIFMGLTYAL